LRTTEEALANIAAQLEVR